MKVIPTFQEYKIALQALQSQRLRRDHADLAQESQYRLIGEFFFEEMYGPRDFSARDAQAKRLNQFVHMVPGIGIRDVEQVLQLLDLTQRLDDSVVQALIEMDAPIDFDEETYEVAYREADNYDDRVRQLELVRSSLQNVYRMARKSMLAVVLNRTEGLARTVGMADIHRFLKLGHQAVQPVKDMHRFIETIYVREKDRLDRIYGLL